MARCPFATWKPFTGGCGSWVGGPYRIVHHTTEGSTAAGAFGVFKKKSNPHFTVDDKTIWQHVDTSMASCALRHTTVQTNRQEAVQIEVVGFAAKPKSAATLRNIAKLCRWIETTHGVQQVWPMGPPALPPKYRSKRTSSIWLKQGGHYGHCHVPGNTHVDPGYTKDELKIITPGA